MSESKAESKLRIPTTQRVIERLTAIKLHASTLQRRLRRGEPVEPEVIEERLESISADVDAAAELVRRLKDAEPVSGAVDA